MAIQFKLDNLDDLTENEKKELRLIRNIITEYEIVQEIEEGKN